MTGGSLSVADDGRRKGGQCRNADDRFVGSERDAARGRKPDAQAGEAAGAGGHRDAVERGEGDRRLLHDAADQRHQRLGVPTLHRLRLMRDQPAAARVEHGGGAGIECGIDRKDQHGL